MPKASSITIVLTVFNEAHAIIPCIENARKLTNDIIVVDTESIDETLNIAKKLGVKTFTFPYKRYVEPSRNFAISKARGDWVFILDADERFTEELIREIRTTIAHTDKTHFKVPRKNIFAGMWPLSHGGWNTDEIIRLIKRDAFVNWPEHIHSTPEIRGNAGTLTEPLEHHFHPSLENMVEKTTLFEDMESELLYKAGRQSGILIFFRKFFGELYRRLIKWQGFLDGTPGIIESVYQAYSKTITYIFLYEKQLKK